MQPVVLYLVLFSLCSFLLSGISNPQMLFWWLGFIGLVGATGLSFIALMPLILKQHNYKAFTYTVIALNYLVVVGFFIYHYFVSPA
jgi:hypothetical protein